MPPLPMPLSSGPTIAVIADPHVHTLYADYGFPGAGRDTGGRTARPLAETARSTRVFNESEAAFRHALDDVARRDICHVVLLGDYSDDGQRATVAGVKTILKDYTARGMRFYATVGNHDIFGAAGRHRTKRFLYADGRQGLVSSDPKAFDPHAASVTITNALFCDGYPKGLDAMAAFGFFRRAGDLHWETPFGLDDAPASRIYEVRSPDGRTGQQLMDASYLVEPIAGVWLLMIDANVFVPVNGSHPGAPGDLSDSTSAGWNAMLRHKPFILAWMKDVAARAKANGKCLLAFSHYPVIDPLNETVEDERAILGPTSMVSRIPREAVAEALMAAGVPIHFSGHLHVNDTAQRTRGGAFAINVAVPSLVAFPAGYKTIGIADTRLHIDTVSIGDMAMDQGLKRLYAAEVAARGLRTGALLAAETYGEFLDAHLAHLVERRHLKRDWPNDLSALLRSLSFADLAVLASIREPVSIRQALPVARSYEGAVEPAAPFSLAGLGALDFLRDWYRFRMGSALAAAYVSQERMVFYRALHAAFAAGGWRKGSSVQFLLLRLLSMFFRYANGLPSDRFTIDLNDGAIEPVSDRASD